MLLSFNNAYGTVEKAQYLVLVTVTPWHVDCRWIRRVLIRLPKTFCRNAVETYTKTFSNRTEYTQSSSKGFRKKSCSKLYSAFFIASNWDESINILCSKQPQGRNCSYDFLPTATYFAVIFVEVDNPFCRFVRIFREVQTWCQFEAFHHSRDTSA